MEDVRGPSTGGKRTDTSVCQDGASAPSNDDGEGSVLAEVTDAVLDAWARESIAALRAKFLDALAKEGLHLVRRPRRPRRRVLPADAGPPAVDPVTREKARALLDAHGIPRGSR